MFSVLRISDPHLSPAQRTEYAKRYTSLRIAALERSPHAFSSTTAIESQLSTDEQLTRLQEPGKSIFVCVNNDNDEWVGQVALVGPMSRAEYDAPFQVLPGTQSASSPTLSDIGDDSYWHMTALYVDDRIRGRGLARLLCEECFRFIDTGLLRIIIKPDNLVVIQMYQRMGFHIMNDKATLLEAIHASRDGISKLPADATTMPSYTERSGIFMLKRLPQ